MIQLLEVLRRESEGFRRVLGLLLAPWPGAPQLSFSSSLLEFQGPDVLRPACPAFGFLIVAAHCAFQDFVLNRKRGEKWKEKVREDTWSLLP